jgi:hypothetical protein
VSTPAARTAQLPGLVLAEHGFEPVRGLPERLPPGETLIWQGSPDWRAFARHIARVHWIAAYFLVLALWRGGILLAGGADAATAATGALWLVLLGTVPVALLALYAVLVARTSVYTLTSKRLVLRVGVALPFTVNLPYGTVESAGLRLHADGTGDIALSLAKPNHVAWLMIWPHARPWRLRDPEPMLRALPDAAAVAQMLGRALAAASGQSVSAAPAAASGAGILGGRATAAA